MKFNFTKGKAVKYLVSLYRWDVNDQYYFHYFKDAKAKLESLKLGNHPTGTVLSLYDVVQDVRKEFVKL